MHPLHPLLPSPSSPRSFAPFATADSCAHPYKANGDSAGLEGSPDDCLWGNNGGTDDDPTVPHSFPISCSFANADFSGTPFTTQTGYWHLQEWYIYGGQNTAGSLRGDASATNVSEAAVISAYAGGFCECNGPWGGQYAVSSAGAALSFEANTYLVTNEKLIVCPSESSTSTGTPSSSATGTSSKSHTGTPSSSHTGTASPSHTGTATSSRTSTPSTSVSKSLSSTPAPVATGPDFKCYGDAHSGLVRGGEDPHHPVDPVCAPLPLTLTDAHRGQCGACWGCAPIDTDDFALTFTLDLTDAHHPSRGSACEGSRLALKLHGALRGAANDEDHLLSCDEDRHGSTCEESWALFVEASERGIEVEVSDHDEHHEGGKGLLPVGGAVSAWEAGAWDFSISYKQRDGRLQVSWAPSDAPARIRSQWFKTDIGAAVGCKGRDPHLAAGAAVAGGKPEAGHAAGGFVGSTEDRCYETQRVTAYAYTARVGGDGAMALPAAGAVA